MKSVSAPTGATEDEELAMLRRRPGVEVLKIVDGG